MKKLIAFLGLVLMAATSFGQAQVPLKPVKIDSLITISLPAKYTKKDTLGQSIYNANGAYGYMTVIRAPNQDKKPLQKEKDLNKVLKDYVAGIKGQSNGDVMNLRDTTVGHLKAKTFTLEVDEGAGVKSRNFIVLYTQDVTYTIEYYYEALSKDLAKNEYKEYSASLKVSPELQRTDQYLSNAKGMSTIAKVGIFGGAALILIIATILVIRRKKAVA
ncbi:hypothetical protein FPZ42_01315 [Mucilaginibacter achroorhodeus]|uniref:Uncharacterized protein n=1 Tax=Mucilaginibacter achroorhodeus TaxID=2599294 RepID=A0A563U914_9SPHI|nr:MULTISPECIES: hypothetical protein [Mucilaginibacter]QXV67152.1 hypothetical protein INP83_08730 [Mucilaginibacter sp. 21P]TWR27881.1 hypothetical protein FPZ42_01315 [Mucilaginibacter achroorhodeus]